MPNTIVDCEVKPYPFLKWAGGKRQLIDELARHMPASYNRYFEPFVGGGALFFHVCPDNACISDINPDLINTYRVIKNHVKALIGDLRHHENTEAYYYRTRDVDLTDEYRDWTNVQKASRVIYLNRTCFNGLYRTNSAGHFNVPYGFYENPKILDEENLKCCSLLLKKTEIRRMSFANIENLAQRGDFVYFDPPYAPLTRTASFTKYYRDDFGDDMQFQLRETCDRLNGMGVMFMVSNSATGFIRELYSNYTIRTVQANRNISCKGDRRDKVREVIVTNY